MTISKITLKISDLMNDVQIAALDSKKDIFDEGYIDDVNRRIGEIETALIALKP